MEELKPEDFKIGDVVRLKSQAYPRMTIEEQDLNIIKVVYFDDNSKSFQRNSFDFALLAKV